MNSKVKPSQYCWVGVAAAAMLLLSQQSVNAQVVFDAYSAGEASTMNLWGFGWIGNTERNITRAGGEQNIDVVRIGSTKEWALDDNNNLHPDAIAEIDNQIARAVRVQQGNPNVRWSMVASGGNGINPWYVQNNGVDIRGTRWLEKFRATKNYVESTYGMDLAYVEVANEQDFGGKIGTKENINRIQERFQADPDFANIPLVGPSTLDSRNALNWYEPAQDSTDWGATHLINGSGSSYGNFLDRVISDDKEYFGSEVHHLVEMLMAEDRGGIGGLWWNNLSEVQGEFIQATEGNVLFYREKVGSTSAAIGYRDIDDPNLIHIFAASAVNGDGGATFQFLSSEVPLLWNGGTTAQNSFTITIGATEERYLQARIPASVPEPSSLAFVCLGMCLIGLKRHRS